MTDLEQLFKDNLNLAYYWSHKMADTRWQEDITQGALIGLWEACKAWKPEQMTCKFSSFAHSVVRNTVIKVKNTCAHGTRTSLPAEAYAFHAMMSHDASIKVIDGEVVNLLDAYIDKSADKPLPVIEEAALDCLSKRNKAIVIKYFGLFGNEPELLREIAAEFDISHQRVQQVLEACYKKLRQSKQFKELI